MSQAQKPVLNRKSKKTTKYENIANQREKMTYYLKGEGLYIYQNNTSGTLVLPKPVISNGVTIASIEKNCQWEGDDYYMSLVRSNMARLIREVISPEEERKQKMLNEEKLILDQPERVTGRGVVEQVVEPTKAVKKPAPKTKLTEQIPQTVETTTENEVLLTEDPLGGVTILS